LTTPYPGFDAGYHIVFGDDPTVNYLHGNFALMPNLEVGATWRDETDGGSSDVALNAKWRPIDETPTRPGVVLGVLDATGSAFNDDPSFYIAIGKSLTQLATQATGRLSKPLRGTLGVGSGFFDGVFASLDWALAPKFSLMAEFTSIDDASVNVGMRWAAAPDIRVDLATIDFENVGAGISLTRRF
jgi:hypothetical protein